VNATASLRALRHMPASRLFLGEDGRPVLPLVTLFLVVMLAFADSQAAGVVAPDVRDTFGFSTGAILAISGGAGFLATCASLPVGFLGDRMPRVDIVIVLAMVLGVAIVGSALAPVAAIYVVARLLTGVGEVSNLPVQQSLLADWYPHGIRPRAFAAHRIGQPVGLIVGGVVAGLVAQLTSWRVAVVVIGMPAFAIAYLAGSLREPVRGTHEGVAGDVRRVRFGDAMRRLWLNRTLRRVWVASFVLGGGYIPLLTLFPLFFKDVYGIGDLGRGVLATVSGITLLLGLAAGGVIGQRLNATTVRGQVFYAGASIAAASVTVLAAAVAHSMVLSCSAAVIASGLGGIYYAPFTQVLAMVCPPRIRSTGLAGSEFAVGLGTLVGTEMIAGITSAHGDRAGLALAGAILAVGGLMLVAAMGTAFDDAVAAAREMVVIGRRSSASAAAPAPALETLGIEFAYEGNQVLFGASVDVLPGETVALLGTNGAGKSTLLKVVAGIESPRRGAVFHDGEDITGMAPEDVARRGIVLVPGGRAVFSDLTVRENLTLATWIHRKEKQASRVAVDSALALFPSLQARIDQPAAILSGGERQMLGLAQGLVCGPRILLIDELTLGLSPRIVEELIRVVRELRGQGLTMLLVEQSVNIAALLCTRAHFMEKGRVRYTGSPAALLQRPDLVRSVFLGGAAAGAR
jgi:branched-chain amino acid transport system ATP-binding protein